MRPKRRQLRAGGSDRHPGPQGLGEPPFLLRLRFNSGGASSPSIFVRANWENAAKNAGLLGSSQQDANVAATLGIFAPGTHVLGVADGLSVEKDRWADSVLF